MNDGAAGRERGKDLEGRARNGGLPMRDGAQITRPGRRSERRRRRRILLERGGGG